MTTNEIVYIIIGGSGIFITLGSAFLKLRDDLITLKERSRNHYHEIEQLKSSHKSHTEELKDLFQKLSDQINGLKISIEQNKNTRG